MRPALHDEFLVGDRVAFDAVGDGTVTGTGEIAGIATQHVFFTYIILLDEPLSSPGYEDWKAVCISGTQLKRLKPSQVSLKS